MRLLILFIFLPFIGQSQIISASPPYRGVAAAGCSKLLDQYADGYAAYSLRLLDCDYVGDAIRVRESGGNTEQDFGFTASGDLDTSAIKIFVGANDGFVVTWFDQIGSKNMSQATSTAQPAIILAGVVQRQGTNNMPSLYFDGGDYFTASFTLAQPSTHFIVGKNGGTNDKHFVDGTSGNRQLTGVSGGNLVTYAGSGLLTFGANSTNFNLYTAIFNGANSTITRNGGGTVTGNPGAASLGGTPSIGNVTGQITGYISEVIFFSASKSSDQTAVEGNINTYYAIY